MKDILNEAKDLKCVYQELPEYLELREEDRRFFDNLFILLVFNESKVYSNLYLSQRFHIPLSTIEKRIRRLARAKLIRRAIARELQDGRWITTARTIELDPVTFSWVKARSEEARIQAMRQEALSKNAYIPKQKIEELQEEVKVAAEPEPPTMSSIEEFRRMLDSL